MGARIELIPSLDAAGTNAYRVLQRDDVTVDRFADVAVLSTYQEVDERPWIDEVARALKPRAIYVKRRTKNPRDGAAPAAPEYGEPVESVVVRENGLAFIIRPAQGLAVGLYLDMRDARAWVREQARGKSVLNLFAYTCAFGVAAGAGGASHVVNVDLSRRSLEWGAENVRLNGLPEQGYVAGDAFRKGEPFDLVIADPPSFSTSKKGVFSAARDYPRLAQAAAKRVNPGGTLVACCNLSTLAEDRFRALVERGLGGRGKLRQRLGPSSVDFPRPQSLKVLIYSLG